MNQRQQREQVIKYFLRVGLFFVVGSWFLSPFLVGQKVVAQTNNSSVNLLNQGIQSQQIVSQNLDTMWNDVLNSGVWDAMVWVGTLFTVGLLTIWVSKVLRDSLNNELSIDYLTSFLWLFLVLLLLINDGANLRNTVLGLRELINLTNEEVLAVQVGSFTLEESFNNVVQSANFNSWVQQKTIECESLPDESAKAKCKQDLTQEIQNNENALKQQNPTILSGQWIANAVGDAFQRGLEIMLFGVSIAFQWLVEITLLLTALISPLAVAGSLLPLQQRPLFTWLLGFYSVGLCKLFYNIIVGLVAHILSNNTPSGNPSGGTIIIAVAVGILSPILAVGLAAGGGMATFMSLGSLMAQAGGVVGGLGLGLAGKGLGMAGRAAKPALQAGARGVANAANANFRSGYGAARRPRYSSSGGGSPRSPQRPSPPLTINS
ncbi:hypothetical protein [Crocosphaera watsonii]|uniref:NAD/NADP transhydrogenase beta subunit n=1 Tax=Crocosphaera watsonii WH 0003 TaxID=423471 RepID=G5JD71_CROWT|nr:hypothetical protein [Crocosphaera watsonii]EHJ09865.1 NAD/NADP transhydrogenase beta subunit [Crocosphaera watsonii WH 0003]